MEREIIEIRDLEPELDHGVLLQRLQLANAPASAKERLKRLVDAASKVARPSGMAMIMAVEYKGHADETHIGGEIFKSGLLREKTSGLGRVFPYIVTEGRETSEWGKSLENITDVVMSRAIRQAVVKACELALERELEARYGIPILSSMNPGSLMDWPIAEQEKMFNLLGPIPEKLGISLLPSMIMQPDYSISGIFFQTDKKFYNCQLCPRDDCPNRKAKRVA